jgi:hypothetical protein
LVLLLKREAAHSQIKSGNVRGIFPYWPELSHMAVAGIRWEGRQHRTTDGRLWQRTQHGEAQITTLKKRVFSRTLAVICMSNDFKPALLTKLLFEEV